MRDEKLILVPDGVALTTTGTGTYLDLMIGTNAAKLSPTGVGTGVDVLGSNGTNTPLAAIIDVGPVSGSASPTAVFTLQSADDTSSTNVTTLGTTASITAAGEYVIPFQTSKRFLRLNIAVTGTSPSFTVSARVGDRPYA